MSTEVIVAIIGASGAVLAAAVAAIGIPIARQGRRLKHVQNQVANGHDTNLRDDIDALRLEVNSGFTRVADRLNLMHADIAWERRERMDLAERLERHL